MLRFWRPVLADSVRRLGDDALIPGDDALCLGVAFLLFEVPLLTSVFHLGGCRWRTLFSLIQLINQRPFFAVFVSLRQLNFSYPNYPILASF